MKRHILESYIKTRVSKIAQEVQTSNRAMLEICLETVCFIDRRLRLVDNEERVCVFFFFIFFSLFAGTHVSTWVQFG